MNHWKVPYWLCLIILILLSFSLSTTVRHYLTERPLSAYRRGQVDALTGTICYELVAHADSTVTWVRVSEECGNDWVYCSYLIYCMYKTFAGLAAYMYTYGDTRVPSTDVVWHFCLTGTHMHGCGDPRVVLHYIYGTRRGYMDADWRLVYATCY